MGKPDKKARKVKTVEPLEGTNQFSTEDEIVIPLAAEQFEVTKQEVITGRVRINKLVREHEEVVSEALQHEQVTVERVPINRYIDEPVPTRQDGDTLIIPIFEEVLVVEKRLMLKEELHVTTKRTTVTEPQTVTLRTETIEVQRLSPNTLE